MGEGNNRVGDLETIRQESPEDAAVIEACARGRAFFYNGPGLILPSGLRVTGEEMRNLVAEAGYNPLTRAYAAEHGPFPPPQPDRRDGESGL